MQFTLTINADSPDELRDALTAIIAGLPAPVSGFIRADILAEAKAKLAARAAAPPVEPEQTAPAPAKAKAAPKAKAPAPKKDAEPEVLDNAKAKSQALEILRECFAIETEQDASAGAKAVKKLMAEMGVDKFLKVPEDQGNVLLTKALAVKAMLTGVPASAPEPETEAETPVADDTDTDAGDDIAF